MAAIAFVGQNGCNHILINHQRRHRLGINATLDFDLSRIRHRSDRSRRDYLRIILSTPSIVNVCFGQFALQLCHSRFRDPRLPDIKRLEIRQPSQFLNSPIGHLAPIHIQVFQILQSSQVNQTRIANPRIVQTKFLQSTHLGHLGQSRIRHLGPRQVQGHNAFCHRHKRVQTRITKLLRHIQCRESITRYTRGYW